MSHNGLIIGIKKVVEYTKISRATIYRMLKNEKFPAPEKIMDGYKLIRAWKINDLNAFMEKRNKPIVTEYPLNDAGNKDNFEERITAIEQKVDEIRQLVLNLTVMIGQK